MESFSLLVILVVGVCRGDVMQHKYNTLKSCKHPPTTTPYKSLPALWMLDCVRQCSHDVGCSSAEFDEPSQMCNMFNDAVCDNIHPAYESQLFIKKQSFTTNATTATPTTTTTAETTTTDNQTTTTAATTTTPTTTTDNQTTTEEPIITTPVTCLNNGILIESSQTCQCDSGYVGDNCERIMKDCREGFKSGHYGKDVYSVYMIKPDLAPTAFTVMCSMIEYGGGTMIMKNTEWTDVNRNLNMNRNWADYKTGFEGSVMENHWIGLQNIYYITSSRPQHLYIQIIAKTGNYKGGWRKYENFKVAGEATNYRMTYSGSFPWSQTDADADNDWTNLIENVPLGDSMLGLNGSAFSTYDQDNDLDAGRNCALDYEGGWWHNACADCNPTGPRRSPRIPNAVNEVFWKNYYINNEITFVEMMLRAA